MGLQLVTKKILYLTLLCIFRAEFKSKTSSEFLKISFEILLVRKEFMVMVVEGELRWGWVGVCHVPPSQNFKIFL